MANLKGFKQVTLQAYQQAVQEGTASNYLWLVRDYSGDTVVSAAIYFGTRKYAELNDDSATQEEFEHLTNTLGGMVDENGEWVGFLPTHEILAASSVTSVEEALIALEDAILNLKDGDEAKFDEVNAAIDELKDAVDEKVAIEDFNEAVESINSAITENADAIEALGLEVATKADADDVYTKDEIDGKISGVFHFNGTAESVSDDLTTLYGGDAGDGLVASEENRGFVYQVGDLEYASNGSVWVELGVTVDIAPLTQKVNELEVSLSAETAAREALADTVDEIDETLAAEVEKVSALETKSTTSASTYADAEQIPDLQLGQIVYVANGESGESGHTAGAYIYTQNGLQKLESSTGTGETPVDRIEALENKVGNVALPERETLSSIVNQLITVEGDDVENA
jgi:hypothetical protein